MKPREVIEKRLDWLLERADNVGADLTAASQNAPPTSEGIIGGVSLGVRLACILFAIEELQQALQEIDDEGE